MKKPEPATLNHGAQFRTVFKTLRDLEGERLLFLCDTFFFLLLNLQYIHCPVKPNETCTHTFNTKYTASSTFSSSDGLHRLMPQHSVTIKGTHVFKHYIDVKLQQRRPSGSASLCNNETRTARHRRCRNYYVVL